MMLKQIRICDVCDINQVKDNMSCVICNKELCRDCYRICPITIGERRQVNFNFCLPCFEEAIHLIEENPGEFILDVFKKLGDIFVKDFKRGIMANNLERGNVDINGKSNQ